MAEDTKKDTADQKNNNGNEAAENEDTDADDSGEEKSEDTGGIGSLFSPEGVTMLGFGLMFDGIGLIPVVGDISDIIAGIFFAAWMIITSKKGWWKFLIALILEAIPIISDIVPFISLIAMVFNIRLPTSCVGCVYSILMGQGGMAKKVVPVEANV
jgi:hypothetical protein